MATVIVGKYHLFKRWYTPKQGQRYFYWWYWYYDDGERKQAAAGRCCTKQIDAREYLEELSRAETQRAHELQVKAQDAMAIKYRDFASALFIPDAQHLKRQANISTAIKKQTCDAHRGRILNYLIPQWGDKPFHYFEEDGFGEEFVWTSPSSAASCVKSTGLTR